MAILSKHKKLLPLALLGLPLTMGSALVEAQESELQRIERLERELAELKKAQKKKAADKQTGAKKNSYKFGGFIKVTGSFSSYSDGDLPSGSAGRDFYIPGLIPVGGNDESTDYDFSAKETRLNFKSNHQLDNGKEINTYLEMDFLLSPGGNERVSNSYNPRLRHAYFTYDKWLFGQTWSTFQDVGALPESVDFLAASDGIVFQRQPMVRFTHGGWQFALENPESTITPNGGGRIVADDNGIPDFVARYNHKADWGHFSISALFRQLAYEDATIDDSTNGSGISITGKWKVGSKNDIRWNFATGSGMGRYVALNTANGAVLDVDGNLESIDSTLAAVAYRHHWSSHWRSNFILSGIDVDNDIALTGDGVTKSVQSYQLNLIYSPAPKVSLGIGYLYADRELENGDSGDMGRLILSAKYAY